MSRRILGWLLAAAVVLTVGMLWGTSEDRSGSAIATRFHARHRTARFYQRDSSSSPRARLPASGSVEGGWRVSGSAHGVR